MMESTAHIVDGKITISVSIETLAHAARNSEFFRNFIELGDVPKITDELLFAKSCCAWLNAEAEDGSSAITRMFDRAFIHCFEHGEDGFELET